MNSDTSFDINTNSNPVQTVAQPKEDNEMLRATDKITALYCRLSVEDTKEDKKNGKEDLSNSIQNQKAMLLQYARDHRFPQPTFFIDDGYSGVTYDRPGFQKMLDEIEAGHVGTVITKDLSRLGRNSALTGLYINYTFPQTMFATLPSTTTMTASIRTAPTATSPVSKTGSMSFLQRTRVARFVRCRKQKVSVARD